MKESTSMRVKRYISGDYYIDIVCDMAEKKHEAWLQHKDYGISKLMFGAKIKEMPFNRFFAALEANLEQYKEDYASEIEEDI